MKKIHLVMLEWLKVILQKLEKLRTLDADRDCIIMANIIDNIERIAKENINKVERKKPC